MRIFAQLKVTDVIMCPAWAGCEEKKQPKPAPQDTPKMPEHIPPSFLPIHCENLEASRELECLDKFFPKSLTAEKLLKIKMALDALIAGNSGAQQK